MTIGLFYKEQKVVFTVTFDEFETMAAFEKLGANGQKIMMELEPWAKGFPLKAKGWTGFRFRK